MFIVAKFVYNNQALISFDVRETTDNDRIVWAAAEQNMTNIVT